MVEFIDSILSLPNRVYTSRKGQVRVEGTSLLGDENILALHLTTPGDNDAFIDLPGSLLGAMSPFHMIVVGNVP